VPGEEPEQEESTSHADPRPIKSLAGTKRKYLFMLAGMLLIAQLVQPIVEYQFLHSVEQSLLTLKERTTYLSWFFALLSIIALLINFFITPIAYRRLGIVSGLLVQPIAVFVCTIGYCLFPALSTAGALKISDRSAAYSIGRSSKELLYIPLGRDGIYFTKALVDMFGNRLSKIVGSLSIIWFRNYLHISVQQLGWYVVFLCVVWILVIQRIYKLYSDFTAPNRKLVSAYAAPPEILSD
ncbi:MAG: hypothetical protein KDD62_16255, partial [Bdellovibrionales bacterium]|nr:hypothetical protein [Bdellovibrionales bacterium]